RQRMTAAFNRGYRSFAAIHSSCTRAAVMAEEGYRNEGATLAQEIAARFGN
ncbi:TIGR02301 family protein, partial [Pseudomonas frederiksbergensis]